MHMPLCACCMHALVETHGDEASPFINNGILTYLQILQDEIGYLDIDHYKSEVATAVM